MEKKMSGEICSTLAKEVVSTLETGDNVLLLIGSGEATVVRTNTLFEESERPAIEMRYKAYKYREDIRDIDTLTDYIEFALKAVRKCMSAGRTAIFFYLDRSNCEFVTKAYAS